MTAACALRMVGVNCAPLDGGDGGIDKAGLVERVGMDRHLNIVLIGDAQTAVNRRRSCAPVFVQLETDGAAENLFGQTGGQGGVPFSGEAEVEREVGAVLGPHSKLVCSRVSSV